jgi:hypothetical protein
VKDEGTSAECEGDDYHRPSSHNREVRRRLVVENRKHKIDCLNRTRTIR